MYKEVLYTITHKLGASGSAGGNPNLASINHLRQLQAQKKPNALSAALAPIWHTAVASNEQESSEKLSKEELYKYAQKAFGINDETHDRLMEEVKEEKVRKNKSHGNYICSSTSVVMTCRKWFP